MRATNLLLAALLVLAGGALPTLAQDGQATSTGTMEGIITDPQQVPLPGATVEVSSAALGVDKGVLTNTDGRYIVTDLPPGIDYVLKVSYSGGGYTTVLQRKIVVRADRTTAESVQLFEDKTEEVIVSAKRNSERVVDLKEIGQVTEFTSEFLEGLPLLGRNYQDILTLAAGVVDPDGDGNPNVFGARAENFNTVIDGVTNQDPLGGGFLSNLNSDTIEQVEVIQSGADASFRRGSGGFANIITKSGSNEFEGTFNFTFRSSLLDGNGATGNPDSDFSIIRPAITLSGALKKDKLWYFISEENFNDENPVNTLSGRNTLIRKTTGDRFLAKLTWAVTAANKLTAQVRTDPLSFSNLGIGSLTEEEAGFTQEQGGPFSQLQLDTVFSPTVLLKSLVAFSDTGVDIIPNNPQDPGDLRRFVSAAFVVNQDTGARSGSFFQEFEDKRQRLTWSEDLTIFVDDFFGRHDIATGISYENEHFERDLFRGTVRTIRREQGALLGGSDDGEIEDGGERFNVDESFAIPANDVAIREGRVGVNRLEGDSDNFGAYITDTWLPRDNVSITAGLRWDREEVFGDGFEQFDPRDEFADWSRFLSDCTTTGGVGNEGARAEDLVMQLFPDEFAAFKAAGQSILNCNQAQGFFFTFPKKSFTNDCRNSDGNGELCTTTLSNLLPTLNVVGNRPPEEVRVNNNNLSPRINVSWDPWSSGKTKFFASWGRFFDKTNLATIVAEQGPDLRSRTFSFTTSQNGRGVARDAGGRASDPTITQVDRKLRTSFNEEWTVGFEREIAPETKIRFQYISRKFRDQLQDSDFNHFVRDVGPQFFAPVRRQVGGQSRLVGFTPAGGVAFCTDLKNDGVVGLVPLKNFGNNTVVSSGPLATPDGIPDDCFGSFALNPTTQASAGVADGVRDLFRRSLFFNNVLFLSNTNESNFEGFTVEFTRRLKRNWQMQASWTHGRSIGAADAFQDNSGNDPSLVTDEFGFTGFDVRNVVQLNITTILPWGDIQLGSTMNYFSGTPFSIRQLENSADNLDQRTLRTVFPTGRRNDQRNDPRLRIDVLAEKSFLIKKYNATATLVISNLLADDFLTIQNVVDQQLQAQRDFGRNYEARFKINF